MDTAVVLGDFVFQSYEVPEKIPFGGDQKLAVHQLVGGARVVDSMGREDMPLTWSGLFMGQGALDRARYLDFLRQQGSALILTWSEFSYTVVIQSFHADFERFYKLPYTITCLVVQDNASPITTLYPLDFNDAINGDMGLVSGYSSTVGDGVLSGLVGTLNTAIGAVSSFAGAAQSTISSVLQPLAAVQAQVSILTTSVNNTLINVSTVGGVLPGGSALASALNLTNQITSMQQMPVLRNLTGVLGRMGANLNLVNGSPNASSMTLAGGNLMTIAAKVYGDATQWTRIAQANNMSDPVFAGVATLNIPPMPSQSAGGVLNS